MTIVRVYGYAQGWPGRSLAGDAQLGEDKQVKTLKFNSEQASAHNQNLPSPTHEGKRALARIASSCLCSFAACACL